MDVFAHWRCPECGLFDGPVTLGRCDACVNERDELVDVEEFLPASQLRGAVEALEKIGGGNSERIRMSAEMAYQVARSALDAIGGR